MEVPPAASVWVKMGVPPAESVGVKVGVPRAERAEWCAGERGEKREKMGGGGWGVHIGDLLPPPPIIFLVLIYMMAQGRQ